MRVLLVEDDERMGAELKQRLTVAGYAVDWVRDGVAADDLGSVESYDAAVLDLGLPGRNGLDVLRNWRARKRMLPVVVLTARGAWQDKVAGFRAGADDYLGKPFHVEELLARLQALIRRGSGLPAGILEVAGLRLDEEHQSATRSDGQAIPLTAMEFRLLRYFMHHAGRILSKGRLNEHLYD
jgi:two-component system, OmpR family, response regulator